MNGAGEGKSCRGGGVLLFLLLFARKKSERFGLELERIWINCFAIEGFDSRFIFSGGKNIVP